MNFRCKITRQSYRYTVADWFLRNLRYLKKSYLKKKLRRTKIFVRPNNILKCELLCKYNVDFIKTTKSIGLMLRFKNNQVLEATKTHESDSPVDVIKVNTVQMH